MLKQSKEALDKAEKGQSRGKNFSETENKTNPNKIKQKQLYTCKKLLFSKIRKRLQNH